MVACSRVRVAHKCTPKNRTNSRFSGATRATRQADVTPARRSTDGSSALDLDTQPQLGAEAEVVVGHGEGQELLQLVLRAQVAGELRLGGHDLPGDLQVTTEQETGANAGELGRSFF